MGFASVSVDLDSLVHYGRIHGLPDTAAGSPDRNLVYELAVPRLLEIFEEAGISGTFFAIGEDLQHEVALNALRYAHQAGTEIGNHSFHHDYALTRASDEACFDEVWRGHQAIVRATGMDPVGFRAPGYTLTGGLYRALEKLKYQYDSSAFAATPYYLAKAGVMGALALLRRPSRAILDAPEVLLSPREPYRPDPEHPYRPGNGHVFELPITVSPVLRVPFIGTFATAFPYPVVRGIYQTLRRMAHFNFELHAIDVLDADDGIPSGLVQRQPDLRVPHRLKRTRLLDVLRWLKHDFDVIRLQDAVQRLAV